MFVRKVKVLKKPKFERKFTTAKNCYVYDIVIQLEDYLRCMERGQLGVQGVEPPQGQK